MKIAEKSIWKYTIVYSESVWSRRCTERIRSAIVRKVGVRLPMVADNCQPRECEILVGKTQRSESREIRATYDRPNIYYDIKVKNSKLVCMGEGYGTLDKIASILEELITAGGEVCLDGDIASGDLRSDVDGNMIDRAEDADIRVLDWNLNAPGNMGAELTENAERTADVILQHLPDVIGTNEMYNSGNCAPYKRFYDIVMHELSPYYVALENSPYDKGQPTEDLRGDLKRYGTPPENIIVRRASGLELVASGYRYTPSLITYHGYHWAVFKTAASGSFIFSVGHYEESRNNPICAIAHMETMKFAQERSGVAETLPEVITGDLFTHYGCNDGGYAAFVDAGYVDAQRCAEVNCNGDIACSTYHKLGQYHPRWASIDLILHNARVKALKFKVITSQEALDVSDHCPVCADLKLENKIIKI